MKADKIIINTLIFIIKFPAIKLKGKSAKRKLK